MVRLSEDYLAATTARVLRAPVSLRREEDATAAAAEPSDDGCARAAAAASDASASPGPAAGSSAPHDRTPPPATTNDSDATNDGNANATTTTRVPLKVPVASLHGVGAYAVRTCDAACPTALVRSFASFAGLSEDRSSPKGFIHARGSYESTGLVTRETKRQTASVC